MAMPSLTGIFATLFIAYVSYSMWHLAQLFTTLQCTQTPCYKYFLAENPQLQLVVFSSATKNPIAKEVTKVLSVQNFAYQDAFEREVELTVPASTRRNGTLHLHVVLALSGQPLEWQTLRRDGPTVIHTMRISEYMEPRSETFKLLSSDQSTTEKKPTTNKPITHLPTDAFITLLIDNISLSSEDVPSELATLIRVTQRQQILPVLRTDFFKSRLQYLTAITSKTRTFNLRLNYEPISIGRLRLMALFEQTMGVLSQMGFTPRDLDEVKGMFSGTNLYLLLCTMFIASIHLLFDFLSFKNDVIFWRNKETSTGLSLRTALWRAISQTIIFFYLLEEHSSLLVLMPAGIGTLIELWKCKKLFTLKRQPTEAKGEQETEQFDKQGMRYLSYLLYPLCVCGAIYSLMFTPQRSWYSWTLQSLANGVYAFGFLFMLPQLFINYKLKSVAALPWRAFMYKAFNTFIDDIFAFIISMPTMHRVGCLRDDVVFLIYLYQRWLYPVDKTRIDNGHAFTETIGTNNNEDEQNKKEN